MDALKKAELAKRQGAEGGADGSQDADEISGLSLEPLTPGSLSPPHEAASLPDRGEPSMSLASHLEELDAQFLEEAAAAARQVPPPSGPPVKLEATTPPPPVPIPEEPIVRPLAASPADSPRRPVQEANDAQVKAAAQNLFAAKQPEKQESRKGFAIAIGVLTVLSVTGIGGYFWWQLQPKNSMIAKPMPAPSAPPAAAPAAPVLAAPAPAPALAQPAAATVPSPTGASTPPGVAVRPATATRNEIDDEPGTKAQARQRRGTSRSTEVADEESPIRVTRQPLRVDPALSRGYEAFNRGELSLAQIEYERARKNDPRNTDVLHGLAAIAMRQGRQDQADALYRQIVETDPQDSVAISALLNQRGQVDPGLTESRLKSIAASQPELAAPQFSLGNLYARLGRWNDAQQAYFRAFNAEPDNPDILYNLAISLEHLRQNKLAAQYYAQAVAAAASRPASFDRDQVAARLKTLQP